MCCHSSLLALQSAHCGGGVNLLGIDARRNNFCSAVTVMKIFTKKRKLESLHCALMGDLRTLNVVREI